MIQLRLLRPWLAGALALACALPATAQQAAPAEPEPDPAAEYRNLFKKPETLEQFWNAIQFEIEIGQYGLAARLLDAMLARDSTEMELVELEQKIGMAPILRLRLIPRWSPGQTDADRKLDEQARKNVETLIGRVTTAVKKHLTDPDRLKKLVAKLYATPEEFQYALKELYRSGADAVPYIIDAMRRVDTEERVALLRALRVLGAETIPPLVAALDSNVPGLQMDVLEILRQRGATEAVPTLWYLMGSSQLPDYVRKKAAETLAYFLDRPISRLPAPRVALTQEAEKYYRGQVPFPNREAVEIWRWDEGGVMRGWPKVPTVPASRAEEYYGIRYATQALALDPTYEPAQLVLTGLLLDKGYERTGLAQPLSRTEPALQQLLTSLSPEMLTTLLERALTEHRVRVILGVCHILRERGEVRAMQPHGRGEPPLVRALGYPDRRVQMAAAEAILEVPAETSAQASARLIDVFRRALSVDAAARGKARVLVGYFADEGATQAADAVRALGYDAVKASTGREVMRRLGQAADIDLLLLDSALPDPQLPFLMGQLRADRYARRLPILLSAADPKKADQLSRTMAEYPNVAVITEAVILEPTFLRETLAKALGDPTRQALSDAEMKEYREKAVVGLARLAGKADLRLAADAVYQAVNGGQLSPAGQIAGIDVIAHLPGARSQGELLSQLVKPAAPREVRIAAADALAHHLQEHGVALTRDQVNSLYIVLGEPNLDPGIQLAVSQVLGSLRPGARLTGERLRLVRPAPPAPPAAPPAPAQPAPPAPPMK